MQSHTLYTLEGGSNCLKYEQALLDHWIDYCSGKIIILPKSYTPAKLYNIIVDSITIFDDSRWVLSKYSHCVKISEVTLDDRKSYTLCVGRDDCNGCNIYESVITAVLLPYILQYIMLFNDMIFSGFIVAKRNKI